MLGCICSFISVKSFQMLISWFLSLEFINFIYYFTGSAHLALSIFVDVCQLIFFYLLKSISVNACFINFIQFFCLTDLLKSLLESIHFSTKFAVDVCLEEELIYSLKWLKNRHFTESHKNKHWSKTILFNNPKIYFKKIKILKIPEPWGVFWSCPIR